MREDLILCQITSKNISFDKYSVELNYNETKNGSLKIDSFIRCNMLFTANKNQIVKVLCKINSKKYNEIIKKIITIISK